MTRRIRISVFGADLTFLVLCGNVCRWLTAAAPKEAENQVGLVVVHEDSGRLPMCGRGPVRGDGVAGAGTVRAGPQLRSVQSMEAAVCRIDGEGAGIPGRLFLPLLMCPVSAPGYWTWTDGVALFAAQSGD
ncbi:MAG: hypothetical protein R2838_13875 [Caldilineaceae bacterium]